MGTPDRKPRFACRTGGGVFRAHDDVIKLLPYHRAVMVANVLAQVRLRNQTEHMGGGSNYLQ